MATLFLYDVCIQLLHGGATVDKKEFHFGLRIVELQQNYEDGGRSFLFRINGRRLFLRGANWVPLNCIYAEIRSEDYDPVFARVWIPICLCCGFGAAVFMNRNIF